MFSNNIQLNSKAVSADAELGRVAISSSEILRLSPVLDNGAVLRSHVALGDLTISHADSKENGGDSRRTLVRFNLKKNGDLPPASAYLVVSNPKTAIGVDRGGEALGALMGALVTLLLGPDDMEVILDPTTVSTGWPALSAAVEEAPQVIGSTQIFGATRRLLNGEA